MTDRPDTPLLDRVNAPADMKAMSDAELRQGYANRGRQLIDGMGVVRVCQKIEALLFQARARA